MDLMHLPRLEKMSALRQQEGVPSLSKPKPAPAPSDSAYDSSEDGSASPASVHRSAGTQSSGIGSSSSRTSLITEVEDDAPQSRSITPDTSSRTQSPLSRTASTDDGFEFSATTHDSPGTANVTVTVICEPDGDNISCDEPSQAEAIDKLLQTVSLPMLWNLPEVSSNCSFAELDSTTEEVRDCSESTTPSVPGSVASFPLDVCNDEPMESFQGRTETFQSFDRVNGTTFSRGCMESSKRQLKTFLSSCREFFTF